MSLPQTSVSLNFTQACAGMLADTGFTDKIHRINNQRQIVDLTVTYDSGTTYTLTIAGTSYSQGSGAGTAAAVVTALIATINADAACLMTARAGAASNILRLTQDAVSSGINTPEDYAADMSVVAITSGASYMTATTIQHQAGKIAFGRGVVRSLYTSDGAGLVACLPTLATSITNQGTFLGIAMQSSNLQRIPGIRDGGEYINMDSMTILRKGRIWAIGEDTGIVEGSPLYCRFTPGTGKYCGNFRSDSDSSTAALTPNCYAITVPAATNSLFLVQVG
jgi:hypothetical protein